MVHPLTDTDISTFLSKNKIPFVFVFRDTVISQPQDPTTCFVVNLDKSNGGGTHWTILIPKHDRYIYFDSWGMKPPDNIVNYLKITLDKLVSGSDILNESVRDFPNVIFSQKSNG